MYTNETGNTSFVASGTNASNEILQGIQYIISRIITFSAVPSFFMLSSVLLFAKNFTWKGNMKKKMKSLVLPYFLWVTLYIFAYFFGQTIPVTSNFFANAGRRVTDMTIMDFIGAYTGVGGHGLFVNALWFLRDLIILNLLATIIKCIVDRFPIFCLVLLTMLWNFGSVPSILILSKQSIVFFALGYYIVKYGLRMKRIDERPLLEIVSLYVVTIVAEFYFYRMGDLYITPAHSFSVILGIMLLIRITGFMINYDENKDVPGVIKLITKYSFFIYASHDMIQTTLKKISANVFRQNNLVQMVEFICVPLYVCAIATVVGVLLNRFAPRLFNVMTGSRK